MAVKIQDRRVTGIELTFDRFGLSENRADRGGIGNVMRVDARIDIPLRVHSPAPGAAGHLEIISRA